jgi:hypothetical protein
MLAVERRERAEVDVAEVREPGRLEQCSKVDGRESARGQETGAF